MASLILSAARSAPARRFWVVNSSIPLALTTLSSQRRPSPLSAWAAAASASLPWTGAQSAPTAGGSFFDNPLAALRELLPPWVLAVPKSKTTHSQKSMRSANKGLKEQQGASSPGTTFFPYCPASILTLALLLRYCRLPIVRRG